MCAMCSVGMSMGRGRIRARRGRRIAPVGTWRCHRGRTANGGSGTDVALLPLLASHGCRSIDLICDDAISVK